MTYKFNYNETLQLYPGIAVLLIAAIGAYASAKNHSSPAYYKVFGSTTQENCIFFLTAKDCLPGIPICTGDIPDVGTNVQLYDNPIEIGDTDRFECINPLEE